METIGEILKKNTQLTKLLNKSQSTKRLEYVFHSMLDSNLARHCQLTNISGSTLNVVVTNSSWATKLHYSIPDIIKGLRTQPEFKDISSIRYSISHDIQTKILKGKPVKISRSNALLLKETLVGLRARLKSL